MRVGMRAAARRGAIFENALREVVVAEPPGAFGVVVVTGLPWVVIDIPEDLENARSEVYRRLRPLPIRPAPIAAPCGARP